MGRREELPTSCFRRPHQETPLVSGQVRLTMFHREEVVSCTVYHSKVQNSNRVDSRVANLPSTWGIRPPSLILNQPFQASLSSCWTVRRIRTKYLRTIMNEARFIRMTMLYRLAAGFLGCRRWLCRLHCCTAALLHPLDPLHTL
jgi:hypothetical protein